MSEDQSTLEVTRQQVNEVQKVMKLNVEKIMERGGKLNQMEERADQLQTGAGNFNQAAVRIQRKYWWENTKMKIIIGVVIAVIVIIIIVAATSG